MERNNAIEYAWLFLCLHGLFGSLGYLATGIFEVDTLDDTDGDSLSHITYRETSQWRELLERFDAQRFAGHQDNDGSIARFDGFWVVFNWFTGTTIDLLLDLLKFAGNVGCVTIQHWGITVRNLSRVIQYDDLGGEVGSSAWRTSLWVTSNVATT